MAGMSTPPGSYVQRLHAQVSTPRTVVASLVHSAVGARVERVDRIVEGYENEVYRVLCVDGQDVVVRILRFGQFSGDFAKSAAERWAIDAARGVGVPAPEVLLLDSLLLDGSKLPVMVQRTVPGRPLSEMYTHLSERQRHDVLAEIGGLIARMGGVQVNDERGWQSAMAAELADRRSERQQIVASGFSASQVDTMLDLLEGYVHDFPCGRWVLCHGDLSPQHIFVTVDGADGDVVRVSGVVDFGDWKPGAPVHDLAVLRVRGPWLDLPPLLAGYGGPADETYRRRLDLHTLSAALSSLSIGVDENDQACVERCGALIRNLLTSLDAPGF